MIETLPRSLRVRDDGTGNGREKNGTLAEFESEDAIILLGDPGMGKTTLFKVAANLNYTTVRNFLIEPHTANGKALFLDALDEYRTLVTGHDASAEVSKALCALNKPKFRLSCRAADWFGSTDQEVFRAASASGRVVVLELSPLSRDEILNAVQGIVPDPITFLDEVEAAGLGTLLGNPQTLELLARAWGTDQKPRNKFEVYEMGVSEQLKETNDNHVLRGVTRPDLSELRKAAGATSSILLLSNSVGISRAETADGNGYVNFSVVPYSNSCNLEAVLKRRLFISSGVDKFEPIHRTIAEFLAAEDLSRRITDGLPIDRVMAMICGVDGSPVASLRGLFAWLMCWLGPLAEDYVERDPYGITIYGDASGLPPNVQCAIWAGLRQLRDPWFLTNEDARGSFRDLANPNTVKIIRELLYEPATGIHLKIAVLEAIKSSSQDIGLNMLIRDMVLDKQNNDWLRTTALKAFAKSVQNDWVLLEALDIELTQATGDLAAPEVRVDLLLLTRTFGCLSWRVLSILRQVASAKEERHIFGRFYPLIDLASGEDLDVILDGASPELVAANHADRFEIRGLYYTWLKRRFADSAPITPAQMANWLRNIKGDRGHDYDESTASLKIRFEKEPALFEEIFELLAKDVPNEERSFWLFVVHDLWEMMPAEVWPVPQSEFFLACAEKENDPERAADLFRMYLSWFPLEGAAVSLAEAGFELLDCRLDVAKAVGDWRSCKIEKWRKNQWKSSVKEKRKHAVTRAQNIAYLTQRLPTIREGGEERLLAWAADIYLGFMRDNRDILDARERLVIVSNEEIADALVQGVIRYAENPDIPKKDAFIERWLANSIPYTHTLLSLSVFLRYKAGMPVPEEALQHCVAAVATAGNAGGKMPDYDDTLTAWLIQAVRQNPAVVGAVLSEIWLSVATNNKKGDLPRYYELSHDTGSQQFLASLAAKVLKIGINEDHDTVGKFVAVLLCHDRQAVLAIGATELSRNELSAEVRAVWTTALFVIDPTKYLNSWQLLMAKAESSVLWASLGTLGGDRYSKSEPGLLTSAQRAAVVMSVGRLVANVEHPRGSWSGSQNPWDVAEFVKNQIKLIAADSSADVAIQLAELENDGGLASYRDLIRHHRAQHEKQQRESSFTFASPKQVGEAIQNSAPATPSDLLAFTVDHLSIIAREIARTQRERYRAYWNENGRNLVKPKLEEVCSGLLAEDLQNRVQTQGLTVSVEHHMVADKECDLVVSQGNERLLPIEAKHHYHRELWTAWRTQLDRLYTRDAKAGGLGIYLVFWSGEAKGRKMPKLPKGLRRPTNATELSGALKALIPGKDRFRLRVVVVDIAGP